ncbi:MAG: hypothetical protein KKB70_05485 [Proteobacteria bacterium]|nr:hypothetical protein [Pseudomonadota bacterium]MBU1612006.1 hypothetical protein [Pseudomonadota bacterium]
MAQVIALDEFRRARERRMHDLSPPEKPEFKAGDVWGRDYTEIEAVVYGILTARQALRYYTKYDDELESLFLEVLEAAYEIEETGIDRLRDAIAPLKDYILEELTEQNMKHMKTALIILDLIEKSPTYK